MKLSAPVFQLKRRAKLLVRKNNVPLHEALDQIAREEGFARWSLLSSRITADTLSNTMLSRLNDGDLLLVAGRPGQGKTTMGLQLLLDAARDNRRAIFFTLESTEEQARKHIGSLDESHHLTNSLEIVTSNEISADYIIRHLSGAGRGTVAVIDYLQILDQERSKPALSDQILALNDFARESGVILAFISQIDRSFDPAIRPLPDMRDIRLPNLVDLRLFNKACFLHNGEAQLCDIN
ncbi:DNA helicase [Phyllobacterium endophyticum]|uniref:DNA helicase n=1 Tax=Phyllobacterium endophyticum TaxID=1149773 RepID=UPI0011CAD62B|nr:DNA helicase [Phyllobacterium endophyticum]TXR50019.1 DNA helicase [Phyllobacterium endophyticum]